MFDLVSGLVVFLLGGLLADLNSKGSHIKGWIEKAIAWFKGTPPTPPAV